MVSYAALSWLPHLKRITIANTSQPNRIFIIKSLLSLLTDEEIITHWTVWSLDRSFFTEDNLAAIWSWLDNTDATSELPAEDRNWIASISDSTANLFEPLAMLIAKRRLVDSVWHPVGCYMIIHSYRNLCLKREFTVLPPKPEQVVELTKWPGFEKTALWHQRVGVTLTELTMYSEALRHFERAFALEVGTEFLCIIRSHMAEGYYRQKDYGMALTLDIITEVELLDRQSEKKSTVGRDLGAFNLHNIQERMAECYRDSLNTVAAVIYFKKALSNSDRCTNCASNLVQILFEN